jgi:hypothetical protein
MYTNGSGSYMMTGTSNTTSNTSVYFTTTAASEYTISNLSVTQLGCVLDLNASGATSANWYDKTNNLTATVSGATLIKPAASNLGISCFNGSTSNVAFTGMDGLTGDITISFKINLNTFGSEDIGTVFTAGGFFYAFLNDNKVYFRREGNTNAFSESISLNTNYTVVITSTSTGITNIYINGVLSGSPNQSAGIAIANYNYNIGSRSSDRYFDGIIDNVIIWSRCLIPEEITLLN